MATSSQSNKKQKTEDSAVQLDDSWNIENPFEKGSIHDEVELKFGSGQSLFVSRAFLMYSSPVFDRMFRADFLENNTNTVELPGKDFEIFHNMLLHMHPGRRKTIPVDHARCMYEMAMEYQMPQVQAECVKKIIEQVESLRVCDNYSVNKSNLALAFGLLVFGDKHNIDSIKKSCYTNISRIGHETFSTHQMFQLLSDQCKIELLLSRANRTDKQTRYYDYGNNSQGRRN